MFPASRQPTSFEELIREIYTTLSLTVIVWMVEEYRLLFDEVPEQKKLLDDILGHATDLDTVQWLCACHLGYTAHAKQLEEWILRRDDRPKRKSVDQL